jgi:hypothetical protein
MKRFVVCVAVIACLFACKKNETTAAPDTTTASTASVSDTAATTSSTEATTAASETQGDPCAFFTVNEATAAFGQPMQLGQQSNKSCEIVSVDRTTNAVTLNYGISDSPVMYDAMSPGGKQLTGIGDKAVWASTAKQLIALKGKRELRLAIIGAGYVDDGTVRPKAEEIAKKIVDRM